MELQAAAMGKGLTLKGNKKNELRVNTFNTRVTNVNPQGILLFIKNN